jgi:predicted NBD/HSP70 family sugar kinase
MYLAIDIGGTKTLLATFTKEGVLKHKVKFETPQDYKALLNELKTHTTKLPDHDFSAACVAVPGRIHRSSGVIVSCGNLGWKNEPIEADLEKILGCPVTAENDANLAGLSEAILIKNDYKKVLYLTISTGIGSGIITNGIIDPELADSEAGHIILDHDGKFRTWESFASGKAIVKRFGKRASEITDETTWKIIAKDLAIGLLDLTAVIQPDIIIIGGGVGQYFDRFEKALKTEMKRYEMPLMKIPPIVEAKHAEEAVVYGCYTFIKAKHG